MQLDSASHEAPFQVVEDSLRNVPEGLGGYCGCKARELLGTLYKKSGGIVEYSNRLSGLVSERQCVRH